MKDLTQIIRSLSKPLVPIPTGILPRLKQLNNIRAVIFDIYGTLFISASGDLGSSELKDDLLYQALSETGFFIDKGKAGLISSDSFRCTVNSQHNESKRNGIKYPEVDVVTIWGFLLRKWQEQELITGKISKARVKEFICRYEALTNPIWPMPFLLETLSWLSERYILGIISNAQFYTPLIFQSFLNTDLQELGFKEGLSVFSYLEGVAKPDLSLFEKLNKKLISFFNTPTENTLFIGNDIKNDIFPAQKAGMKTALFAGDKRSLRLYEDDDILKKCIPSVIITELSQIKQILI